MSTEPLENLEELARRAVACKRWRWMPGMMAIMTEPHDGETTFRVLDYIGSRETGAPITMYPDLTDPATVGCLLALVREAWKKPHAYPMANSIGEWIIQQFDEEDGIWRPLSKCFKTEAEALVAALEVAP
jgi:hypothetical protein